jgi:hypothetical protein
VNFLESSKQTQIILSVWISAWQRERSVLVQGLAGTEAGG